jgi:hypothetical protein
MADFVSELARRMLDADLADPDRARARKGEGEGETVRQTGAQIGAELVARIAVPAGQEVPTGATSTMWNSVEQSAALRSEVADPRKARLAALPAAVRRHAKSLDDVPALEVLAWIAERSAAAGGGVGWHADAAGRALGITAQEASRRFQLLLNAGRIVQGGSSLGTIYRVVL